MGKQRDFLRIKVLVDLNIEKIKKEKNSSDILGDIFYYAVFGEKISLEDLERFKWYGIYAQDENQEKFSLKIPFELGELDLNQLKTVLKLLKDYKNDSLFIEENQNIVLKDLKLSDLPNIFNILKSIDLTTFYTQGHNIRRVLTCPVNGVDATQIYDVEDLAKKLNETFVGNKNFLNLPNSFKIAISGYLEGCDVGFTPDISFNATLNEKSKVVFLLKVLDYEIGFVNISQVIPSARAIANIYKDFGQRDENSSFEDFIDEFSINSFCDIFSSMIDFKAKEIIFKNHSFSKKPRFGLNKSKNENECFIGLRIKEKKISTDIFEKLLTLIEKYEAKRVKLTHKSNLIILDIPTKNALDLEKDLLDLKFVLE